MDDYSWLTFAQSLNLLSSYDFSSSAIPVNDDFAAVAIPEPNSLALLLIEILGLRCGKKLMKV